MFLIVVYILVYQLIGKLGQGRWAAVREHGAETRIQQSCNVIAAHSCPHFTDDIALCA